MFGRRNVGQRRLRGRLCSTELASCAPGQLSAGANGAADRLGDGVEGNTENIVQDEGDPLAGAEPAQNFQ